MAEGVGVGFTDRSSEESLERPSVLPLLVVAPTVTLVVTAPFLFQWVILAVVVSGVVAAAVGMPSLWIALRLGLKRHYQVVLLGGVVSALATTMAGTRTFALPAMRPEDLAMPVAIGAASGSVYWRLFLGPDGSSARLVAAHCVTTVVLAVLATATLVLWPEHAWPRYTESTIQIDAAWSLGEAIDQNGTREVRLSVPLDPPCRPSVFLPALVEYLQREKPTQVRVLLLRRYEWFRPGVATVHRIGPLDVPYPSTAMINCK
jgi:hypothetical protein